MTKKFLIFGATGAVGSSLSKLMKEDSLQAHLVGKNKDEVSKLSDETAVGAHREIKTKQRRLLNRASL